MHSVGWRAQGWGPTAIAGAWMSFLCAGTRLRTRPQGRRGVVGVLPVFFCGSSLFISTAQAQLKGTVQGGQIDPLPIAIAPFIADGEASEVADTVASVISNDLGSTGYFSPLPPDSFIEQIGISNRSHAMPTGGNRRPRHWLLARRSALAARSRCRSNCMMSMRKPCALARHLRQAPKTRGALRIASRT